MFGVLQILVSARLRRAGLAAAAAALLAACGQKGPLFQPAGEASTGRATLPQTLTPSTSVVVPTAPASAPSNLPPTGTAAPVRNP